MSAEAWVPSDTFGTRLLLVRHQRDLTIEEAARRTGVALATWATWEHGARPRDMARVVARIADQLGVSRDWLMWGGPLGPTEYGDGHASSRCIPPSPLVAA